MQKITNFISKLPKDKVDSAHEWSKKVLSDVDVNNFIKQHEGISQDVIERDFTRLSEYVMHKDGNGHTKPHLSFDEGFITVIYAFDTESDNGKRISDGVMNRLTYDNITEQFKGVDFSGVKEDEHNALVILAFIRQVKQYSYKDGRKGIWLHGKFGRGKSHIMGALATELYKKGAGVTYYHAGELIKRLKRSMDYRNNDIDKVIDHMKKTEVLIIDDIGTEAVSSWSINDVIYEVLNARMKNNSLTFFNSNLTQKEYVEHLKSSGKITGLDVERLNERIEYLAKEVYLGGGNWRVKA